MSKMKTMEKLSIFDPDQKRMIGKSKLNILVVDDDDGARETLCDMLRYRGHNITSLDEGSKCVNRCYDNKYDIIFMDYHMSNTCDELSGTDVTQIVRDCFSVKSDIYAYTGDSSSTAVSKFKNNNMKGVFIKPVTPSLMNTFFDIIEKNTNDNNALAKLSLKNKNFMFFRPSVKKHVVTNIKNTDMKNCYNNAIQASELSSPADHKSK